MARILLPTAFLSVFVWFSNAAFKADLSACQCVPQHLCEPDNPDVDGVGLMDIRLFRVVCQNYFEVCCEKPITGATRHQQPLQMYKDCGYQKSTSEKYRITAESSSTNFAELPWSVMILYKDPDLARNIYKCGGSLIHLQVVLTAAHCLRTSTNTQWIIRAGEWDTSNQDEPLPYQERSVKEITIHPQFNSRSLKNDIALLFLSEPLHPNDNIGYICLPPPGTTLDNSRCIASGWGTDTFKNGRHSSILKKVELPIVSRDHCLKSLRSTKLGKFYNLHKSFICAGGEQNRDTCQGDGGSPLVCPIPEQPGRFLQMGIVSWGIGCGASNTPGVYVNVALYRDWVDEQLATRNFNTRVYRFH